MRAIARRSAALVLAACCAGVGSCSSAVGDSTLSVACDCVLPDGGIYFSPYVSGTLNCITREEAQSRCAPLRAQVPADAGYPMFDCVVNLTSCHCNIGSNPDCAGD